MTLPPSPLPSRKEGEEIKRFKDFSICIDVQVMAHSELEYLLY
jgi:hypothetical protein